MQDPRPSHAPALQPEWPPKSHPPDCLPSLPWTAPAESGGRCTFCGAQVALSYKDGAPPPEVEGILSALALRDDGWDAGGRGRNTAAGAR